MATATAPKNCRASRISWQMPTFLLGSVALSAVLLLRFVGLLPPGTAADRLLAEAHAALDAGDYDRAKELSRRGVASGEAAPHAAEFRFLLGSACLGKARQTGDPQERAALLEQARSFLREAERLGIGDRQRPRLQYRLMLCQWLQGAVSPRLVHDLEENLESNVADRIEGFELLVSHYLSQRPPQWQAALRANERLLAQPMLAEPNPVRLRQGELLLSLDRTEPARQILLRIEEGAAEYADAQHVLALCWFQERDWPRAAAVWQRLLNEVRPQPPRRAADAAYYLGLCLARMDQAGAACDWWARVRQEYPQSAAAWAAGVQLAAWHASTGRDDDAVRLFAETLAATPAEANPLLDSLEAAALIEESWQHWHRRGRHEPARQLARQAKALLVAGESERWFALSSRAAAQRCLDLADYHVGPESERHLELARKLFFEAGEAYEALARIRESEPDWLWQAAECYLRGRHYTRAAALLERYLTLDLPDKRRAEALVGLGEAQRGLRRSAEAEKLLQEVIRKPSAVEVRARYLLALTLLDQGKFEEAESLLRDILAAPVLGSEPREMQQSYFTLGYVLFRRGQFLDAAGYLERAIEKKARDPQRLQARYWLGESFRQAARQQESNAGAADTEAARRYSRLKRTEYLEKAYSHFWSLAAELAKRRGERPLTEEERLIFRESRFGIGDTLFYLGRFDEAASIYEALAAETPTSGDSLRALMELVHLQLTLQREKDARQTLKQARELLDRLDDAALEESRMKRQQWQAWIEGAEKLCK